MRLVAAAADDAHVTDADSEPRAADPAHASDRPPESAQLQGDALPDYYKLYVTEDAIHYFNEYGICFLTDRF